MSSCRLFRRVLATLPLLLVISAAPPSWGKVPPTYDVIVAGGGAGGVGAAVAAARLGAKVALLEETDWLGGQMTAAAVSTMDDLSGNKTGIYGEFYESVLYHYFKLGKSISTCYWDGSTTAFEPSVGRDILVDMVRRAGQEASSGGRAGKLDVYYDSSVKRVHVEESAVRGITADVKGKTVEMRTHILIDTTECGDVLPLSGAAYRSGNTVSPGTSGPGRIQDITWVAVMKRYSGGIPPHLRIQTPPPGYDRYVPEFRKVVAAGGNSFRDYPLRMPVDFATHNGYRGLPDSSNPENYDASTPEGWAAISKTGINWANDYPGVEKWEGRGGLPIAYLEDEKFRRTVDANAMLKTLCFLYYVQEELGEPWSVADDEFDSEWPLRVASGVIPGEYNEILRRFPIAPYIRESRRVVGLETPTSSSVRWNSESYRDGTEGREIPTAMAIGGYILDLHAGDEDRDLESEFGETFASIRTNMPRGPFQIPFGSFIPKELDGFLVAEKNLSMSRLVSGAFRLQPISMLTGQAAGTIAALAVKQGVQPRALDPRVVQRALLEAGSALSLCEYSDVPRGHPLWPAVQMSNLYGWIVPEELPSAPSAKIDDIYNNKRAVAKLYGLDKGVFGVTAPLTGGELSHLFEKAFAGSDMPFYALVTTGSDEFVTREDFVHALTRAMGYTVSDEKGKEYAPRYADVPRESKLFAPLHSLAERGVFLQVGQGGVFMPSSFVTRGEAADMTMRAVTAGKGR